MENAANWTIEEYSVVYHEYPTLGPIPVANKLNRPVNVVVDKALRLGVNTSTPFTEEEIATATNFGRALGKGLMFMLPHRSSSEIVELLKCVGKL